MQKLADQRIFFDGFRSVAKDECSTDVQSLLNDKAEAGSLVWHQDFDKDRIFVKCAEDSWVAFEKATVSGIGTVNAQQLVKKLLKKKKASGAS